MSRALSVLLLLCIAGLTACVQRVPLTYALKYQYALTEQDLQELQYYVSHDITLFREVERHGHEITPSARLVLIDGKEREVIRIPAGTPCVAARVGPDWLEVRFEPGEATLRFQAIRQLPESNPRRVSSRVVTTDTGQVVLHSPGDRWEAGYKLVGREWRHDRSSDGLRGTVLYGDEEFIADDSSSRATLLIDGEKSFRTIVEDRVVPGQVLPESGPQH